MLIDSLSKGGVQWGATDSEKGVGAVIVARGKRDDDVIYSRSTSMQLWMFGYEIMDTITVFTPKNITILTSKKKAGILGVLGEKDKDVQLEVRVRSKTEVNEDLKFLVGKIGSRAGTTLKEKPLGDLVPGFYTAAKEQGVELVDVSGALSSLLYVKDENELEATRDAASQSSKVLKNFLKRKMEKILDQGKKATHAQLADATDDVVVEPKKVDPSSKLDEDSLESCYTPIIQSGGEFNLKPNATSDERPLSRRGAIIMSVGVRYKSYCSNIVRTYLVDPTQEEKEAYVALTEVYLKCREALVPGAVISGVYKAAVAEIEANCPDLLPYFTKNCGFGMGIEFRDSTLLLDAKNKKKIQPGMVFNLAVGFGNIKSKKKKGKQFAVMIADTFVIGESEAKVLTHVPRSYEEIIYRIASDEAEEGDASGGEDDGVSDMGSRGVAKENLRRVKTDTMSEISKIREMEAHQRELAKKKNEEALRRLAADNVNRDISEPTEFVKDKPIESYKTPLMYPNRAKPNQLHVDIKSESLLCPIGGRLVPFHINTIKNANKSEQNGYVYLSINFITPDTRATSNIQLPSQADVNQKFVHELIYRSQSKNLDEVFFNLKELRKRVTAREREHEEKQTLVEQEDLVRASNPERLRDVQMRPTLARGKFTGVLETHVNGVRFVAPRKNVSLDITYKNIRHAFFQPATKDTSQVLIHLQLHNEIIIGKKKADFVQFYFEVIDASQDLGTRARYRDEDGLLEEQQEKKLRQRWNERFHSFTRKIEEVANKHLEKTRMKELEFDVPFKDLSFTGVPYKENVRIMPTVHCLLSLEDNPPMCITLDDVEIVSFERVQFQLKNFDMVFVFKDFNRAPMGISAIPSKDLDMIKEWLNKVNILFYESKINLVWKTIMAEITADPEAFFSLGGWDYIFGDDGDGEEEEEEMDEESEFEPEGSEGSDSEEYESSEDYSESESEEEEEDSEDAADWDELEEEAKKEDQMKARKDMEKERREEVSNPRSRKKRK